MRRSFSACLLVLASLIAMISMSVWVRPVVAKEEADVVKEMLNTGTGDEEDYGPKPKGISGDPLGEAAARAFGRTLEDNRSSGEDVVSQAMNAPREYNPLLVYAAAAAAAFFLRELLLPLVGRISDMFVDRTNPI